MADSEKKFDRLLDREDSPEEVLLRELGLSHIALSRQICAQLMAGQQTSYKPPSAPVEMVNPSQQRYDQQHMPSARPPASSKRMSWYARQNNTQVQSRYSNNLSQAFHRGGFLV